MGSWSAKLKVVGCHKWLNEDKFGGSQGHGGNQRGASEDSGVHTGVTKDDYQGSEVVQGSFRKNVEAIRVTKG